MKIERTTIDGVFIEHASPESAPAAPPVVFVHGGAHGSWAWENYLGYFAATGRDCYAFSWFNHEGSAALPDDRFAARSLADTVEELEIVTAHVGQAPVLMTHSMGAIVAQKYAERHPVVAQVHLAPAVCAEVGLDVEFDIDPGAPVERLPFEVAWGLYLGGCSEEDAGRYHALMSRESAVAVKEAVTASVSVDRTRIGGPSLVVAAEHDAIVPAEAVRRSAAHFGSDYLFLPDRSHNVLLEPRWRGTADRVRSWLDHRAW
ncbi:alpha/beta hydrolase [Streptomyces sp. NBC_01477]|uniref:alpha/beta hydrolase n=1 Tax=Streptomyces sp. NBC_01477 TaxID=2976015 RepID=UPI002E2F54D6|nr:alpha/beta fold hydrolase [Streptomyces sp. NBC_01477]